MRNKTEFGTSFFFVYVREAVCYGTAFWANDSEYHCFVLIKK